MPLTDFPPNVPRKLICLYKAQGGTERGVARALGVNQGLVHRLLVDGKEPVDENIRVKLFLPRKPRAARRPRVRVVWHEDLRDCHIHLRK